MKIAILYPRISHYREEFFQALMKKHDLRFFLYESQKESFGKNFKNSQIDAHYLKTLQTASSF